MHILLFIVTLLTTTIAGIEWIFGKSILDPAASLTAYHWTEGAKYSFALLGALTVHEFGHYFTALYYRVKVTLPYYIPFWGFSFMLSIGTMGAFIKMQSPVPSRKQYFDIGIAGPLAGLVIGLGVLFYGYTHLPPKSYVLEIHPEYRTLEGYKTYGNDYEQYAYENREDPAVFIGKNLFILLFENNVANQPERIPDMREFMHYPFLLAGYLTLLFTALNLIPIGQLDGGHILYGLIGRKAFNRVAPVLFFIFVTYAGIDIIDLSNPTGMLLLYVLLYFLFLYLLYIRVAKQQLNQAVILSLLTLATQLVIQLAFPMVKGYAGWLVFALLLGRFLGVYHPPTLYEQPLSLGRQLLGWFTLLVFVCSFTPYPIEVVLPDTQSP
ncbi:MAG: site-2 protease family protein [Thermonemataceae bacterium]